MNELMVKFGNCGWCYYKTNNVLVGPALKSFWKAMESAGIELCSLDCTDAELRNADGINIDELHEKGE